MTPQSQLSWVIGRRGLLGQSVESALALNSNLWHPLDPIRWLRRDGGASDLRDAVGQFLVAAGNDPWVIAWCAGAGTSSATPESLQLELVALRETLNSLDGATRPSGGLFFFASSAGGVYSGVDAPPYDERSPLLPLSHYGRAKLEAESLVTEWSQRNEASALIGRIANLYGPGQNISKPQGIISQICRSYLLGYPLSIYVSLDTLRDYIFAPDCAALVADALTRLRSESSKSGPLVVTKILASQHAITIGAVLGEMRRIFKSPPHIVIAASEASSTQARDLILRSIVWPELDRRELTPFPVGVAITAADLRRKLQDASL